MIKYEMRFTELSLYAVLLVPINAEKVKKVIGGLHYGIRLSMARE